MEKEVVEKGTRGLMEIFSVKDKLPQDCDYVAVINNRMGFPWNQAVYYKEQNVFVLFSQIFLPIDVTHWYSMPDIPKSELL